MSLERTCPTARIARTYCEMRKTMAHLVAERSSIKLVELRNNLGDKVNEVSYTNHRLTITRNGKPVAALISVDDLALLEELELKQDAEDMARAIAEDDGYRVSLEDFEAKHGLA